MLDDSPQAFVEGWAIVDNTTGEDWTSFHISLVSGKPISFISQLYPPKYVKREGAELPEDAPVAPRVYSGGLSQPAAAGLALNRQAQDVVGGASGGRVGGFLGGLGAAAPPSPGPASGSTVSAAGAAQEIADLFEYTIASAVTVKKDEAAMLPFLQQKIAARKLLMYSDTSRPNPLNAAELTNGTGMTLDGGPITVYDSGTYAGEALVETVKAGDKRFISYGVDLGTRIGTNLGSETNDARELHARRGMLTVRSAQVQKRVYMVLNVDPRRKTLIIEYPARAGWELVDTVRPIETARDVHRFQVSVPAKGSVEFPVTAEHVYDQQISVASVSDGVLLAYIRNRNVSDAGRRRLEQIADLKTQIADAQKQKDSLAEQISGLAEDEKRSRENIQSLSAVSGQQQTVQDYARRLSEQETRIGALRDQEKGLDQKLAQLRTELDERIEKPEF